MKTVILQLTALSDSLVLEKIVPGILFAVIIFLAFYNLSEAPATWNDEGAAMLIARSLVENGKYAVRSSDGFQTFGPIQSVGPTVILPVALSFKLFGIGVLQGRIVAGLYMVLTLLLLYALARSIFGTPAALLGILFMLGSTSSQFLFHGRQVLGEVPALGFLMGSLYVWIVSMQKKSRILQISAGVMMGLAMITKSSYPPLIGALLAVLVLLEKVYYRKKYAGSLVVVAILAFLILGLWILCQRHYFGPEVSRKNSETFSQLFNATSGLDLKIIVQQGKFLFGIKNDSFYFLWGIPALLFGAGWCFRRDIQGFTAAILLLFAVLWLGYYFYSVPWPAYLFVPASLSALFLGRFWVTLLSQLRIGLEGMLKHLRERNIPQLGFGIALWGMLALLVGYPLQNAVQFNVLSRSGPQHAVTDFLNREIPPGAVVETWDKELGILTSHDYHYPDPEILIQYNNAKFRGGPPPDPLGYEYFSQVKPAYLVIGRFERQSPIYDREFIAANTELLGLVGEDAFSSYEIYKLNYPLAATR